MNYCKKSSIGIFCLFLTAFANPQENILQQEKQPVDYVNPYMGNISHLLVPTFPTIHLPNSMLRVIPDRMDYTSDKMNGLPVVTTSHRGSSAFNISPVSGIETELSPVYNYSYDQERITPYSWDVFLDEQNIEVSFGVSNQSGIYFMNFADSKTKYLIINNRNGKIKFENGIVTGFQVVSNEVTKNTTKVDISD